MQQRNSVRNRVWNETVGKRRSRVNGGGIQSNHLAPMRSMCYFIETFDFSLAKAQRGCDFAPLRDIFFLKVSYCEIGNVISIPYSGVIPCNPIFG